MEKSKRNKAKEDRPLSKLVYERQVLGNGEPECIDEDLSAGVTTQLSSEVEFRKQSNKKRLAVALKRNLIRRKQKQRSVN